MSHAEATAGHERAHAALLAENSAAVQSLKLEHAVLLAGTVNRDHAAAELAAAGPGPAPRRLRALRVLPP